MTEKSYFWDHGGGGHSSDSPYDSQEFQKILGMLAIFKPYYQGVIRSWGNAFSNSVSGLNVTIRSGRAIVENAFYESDGNVIHTLVAPASGYYYYRIVLRKDNGAQTVRQKLLGPTVGTYPPVIQTDAVWDMPLAGFTVSSSGSVGGGVVEPVYIHPDGSKFFPIIARLGGSATTWSTQGTTFRAVALESTIQTGIALWSGSATSGSVVVTFPIEFDDSPIVFLGNPDTVDASGSPEFNANKIITAVSGISSSGFTLNWSSIAGVTRTELYLSWMAIGPKAVR